MPSRLHQGEEIDGSAVGVQTHIQGILGAVLESIVPDLFLFLFAGSGQKADQYDGLDGRLVFAWRSSVDHFLGDGLASRSP